jgi:MoaA/NifB/PqqE/SkfB family radical SAM enzyme
MSPDLLTQIMPSIAELNGEGRIELTRRGEPTLNPNLLDNVAVMRKLAPKMQISLFTNGVELIRRKSVDLIVDLINAGVNILNIDCYDSAKHVGEERMYHRYEDMLKSLPDNVILMDFREFSSYRRYSKGHKLRVVNLVPDIADPRRLVKVRKLHNAAGNTNRDIMEKEFGITWPTEPLKKNCAKPHRELVINWDGTVPICCEDWSTQSVLGKMPEKTASEIWYGKLHHEILKSLWNKDRSGVPCNVCSFNGGFRLGLLHNPNTVRPKHLWEEHVG